MGYKVSSSQRTITGLTVDGAAPQVTLRPKVVYHSPTETAYIFGGDVPDSEVGGARQRNSLHCLRTINGRLGWSGPHASTAFCNSPNDSKSFNLSTGVVNRSAHVWLESAHPQFLMAQGGQSNDRYGVSFMDQGGLADWLAFDIRSQTWMELQPPIAHNWENSYAIPEERAHRLPVIHHHAAALDSQTGNTFLFLAFPIETDEPSAISGFPGYVFDTTGQPSTWNFRRLQTTGQPPSPRAGYTCTIVGRRLVVFGGFIESLRGRKWQTEYPSDINILDLDTMNWRSANFTGVTNTRPSGRIEHGAIALDEDRLLILGGGQWQKRGFESLQDAFILDFKHDMSTKLKHSVHVPLHAAWLGFGPQKKQRILALGGDTSDFQVFEMHIKEVRSR